MESLKEELKSELNVSILKISKIKINSPLSLYNELVGTETFNC